MLGNHRIDQTYMAGGVIPAVEHKDTLMEPILLLFLFGPPLGFAWLGVSWLWKGLWLDERTIWLDEKERCAAQGLRVERTSTWKPEVRRKRALLILCGTASLLLGVKFFVDFLPLLRLP